MIRNPLSVPVFIVLIWLLVTLLISQLSGWAELAKTYSAAQPFEGPVWRFQSAQMRWRINYNHPLTVGANETGLSLSAFPLLRIGHPPLFVPWQDISVRTMKYLWFRIYQFNFRQAPSVPFRVREALGRKIETAAGSAWPGERFSSGAAF